MNIVLTFNVRHTKPDLSNKQYVEEAEFDEPSTIEGIKKAIESHGHRVLLIEADENAFMNLKSKKEKLDLVFNIAEGMHGNDREAQIPAILEMLEIPYIGSKPLAQSLCLNKAKAKEVLSFSGIPTPDFQIFVTGDEPMKDTLRFPLIVKPNGEGSSKGITQDCFVRDENELRKKAREIITSLHQPALAEEFLSGREFTIAIIGNDPPEILAPVEIDYSKLPREVIPFDSYEVKWVLDTPESGKDFIICPAKIDSLLWEKVKTTALQTKEALGVLDWLRIDMRLDARGIPNVIEVNQIPGIIPDPKENSRFPLAARMSGYSYEEMIGKIIDSACRRYGIPSLSPSFS